MMLATKVAVAAAFSLTALPAMSQDNPAEQTHWLHDEQTGCRAPDPDFAEGDGIVWTGPCSNGIVNGQGSLTFVNKGQPQVTITGNFRDGNLETGRASLAWPDGSKYDGGQVGGKFEGQGVFVSAQQDKLDGEWKDGVLNGHATVNWANGNRYEGNWVNGKAEGHGIETWANGDRYDGEWHDGKAQGRGVQAWANGQSYDGEWRDDQPNGIGKLVRADGTKFEGKFVDGHPQGDMKTADDAVTTAPVAASAAPTSAPTAGALPAANPAPAAAKAASAETAAATATAAAANSNDKSSPKSSLSDMEGKKLVAVDGSSIAFAGSEGGFTRTIAKSDGTSATTLFTFVNDRMGTVSDASDSARVTGLFKITDAEIDVDYDDGHAEVLRPGAGGVTLALHSPDGGNFCVAWYPETHVFSEMERKAALAAYASKLGLPLKGADAKALAHSAVCTIPTPAAATLATVRPASIHLQNVPRPLPRPIQASFEFATPAAKVARTMAAQPIVVRTSEVHLIDAPKPRYESTPGGQSSPPPVTLPPSPTIVPATASAAVASVTPPPAASGSYEQDENDPGASSCLTVASDGSHWGFKNACNYSVQFAYCLKGDSEPLAACKEGAVNGSAAPAGFSALVADGSVKEKNIDHQFRWVACSGGAGEVVPKLDGVDPPIGRCLRARSAAK